MNQSSNKNESNIEDYEKEFQKDIDAYFKSQQPENKIEVSQDNKKTVEQQLDELIDNDLDILNAYAITPQNLENLRNMINKNETENQGKESSSFYLNNLILSQKVKELLEENKKLKVKLNSIEQNNVPSEQYNYENGIFQQKRKRRLKTEIQRNFVCDYKNCPKSYGLFKKNRKFTQSTYQTQTS